VGYISHTWLDLSNLDGVRLTYPLAKHHRWVFPFADENRIKADSPRENGLRMIGLVIMVGVIMLNVAGGRSMFHSFLGTPEAIGRDYAAQLKNGSRISVRIEGVWTRGQGTIHDSFDVIASNATGLFVRRPGDPRKIYQVSGGPFSAISHPRLKIQRRRRAEQRIVTLKFDGEKWKGDLALQYPFALVSGAVVTRAKPPSYSLDEFPTIVRVGQKWELTHAPIELVDSTLRASRSKLRGELLIRYWQERENDEIGNDNS
jgi:hypothetical protein